MGVSLESEDFRGIVVFVDVTKSLSVSDASERRCDAEFKRMDGLR